MQLSAKQKRLEDGLSGLGRTLVAYSGGVDSAYLAWAAWQVLKTDMLAVIADSPSLARTHLQDAVAFAQEHGIPLEIIQTAEMDRPEYVRNDPGRCFQCKDELFQVMRNFAQQHDFRSIAYGVNVDDQGDFRPGQAAASRHHIAAPLLDAELTSLLLPAYRLASNTAGRSRVKRSRPWSKERMPCGPLAFASFACAITATWSGLRLPRKNWNGPSAARCFPSLPGYSKPLALPLSAWILRDSAPGR